MLLCNQQNGADFLGIFVRDAVRKLWIVGAYRFQYNNQVMIASCVDRKNYKFGLINVYDSSEVLHARWMKLCMS